MESRKINSIYVHLFFWSISFAIPLLFYLENPELGRLSKRIFVTLVSSFVYFYSNLWWAIDKLLYKKRYIFFVVFNIVLFFAVRETREFCMHFIDEPDPHHPPRENLTGMSSLFVYNDFIFFVLTVGASFGVRYFEKLNELEIQRKRLENETLTSELSLLRYQIQPHFFFNSLNNIYSLIGHSPTDAQKAVHSLSKMMRYILYESNSQSVLLSHEIEFLSSYISLMKLRLSKEAKVDVTFASNASDAKIPSLMLIPMVENAFKHGLGPSGQAEIKCHMSIEDNFLIFSVVNRVYSVETEDKSHSGIGVSNLKKRLDIIYGKKHEFRSSLNADGSLYETYLRVPLSEN